MKTVQDYLDLGLVLDSGDKLSSDVEGGWIYGKSGSHLPLEYHGVVSFEWRNNDGVKPEYRGVIEVALRNGSTCCKYDSDAYLWPKAFSSVFKWRPVVLQSESPKEDKPMRPSEVDQSCREPKAIFNTESTMFGDRLRSVMDDFENGDLDMSISDGKPVYTAEMHAKGELPPVGVECILIVNNEPRPAKVTYIGKDIVCYSNVDDDAEYACLLGVVSFKPIIKTIKVNGFDVPAPMSEAPECGSEYFIPSINNDDFVDCYDFHGDSYDRHWLSRGLIHFTKSAAIAHAKAMLGIDPNA